MYKTLVLIKSNCQLSSIYVDQFCPNVKSQYKLLHHFLIEGNASDALYLSYMIKYHDFIIKYLQTQLIMNLIDTTSIT